MGSWPEISMFTTNILSIERIEADGFTEKENIIYDGYIGIQPPFHEYLPPNLNFINSLLMFGMIEHPVVAIYINNNPINGHETSLIEFGSWDELGVEKGKKLFLLKTKSCFNHMIQHSLVSIDDSPILNYDTGEYKDTMLDPSLPHIHIPSSDFETISNELVRRG